MSKGTGEGDSGRRALQVVFLCGFVLAGLALLATIVPADSLMSFWHWLLRHLAQETGISSSSSHAYNFFSGFGSDLGELAIIGGLVQIARHANCESKGCWRFGRHGYEKDGVTHKLCRRCHPVLKGKRHTKEEFLAHYYNKTENNS